MQDIARKHEHRLLLAPTPARMRWEIADLAAADGHGVRVVFQASLRAVDDPTERKTLEEMLLHGRDAVTASDAESHYLAPLATAAKRLVETQPAAHWLSDAGQASLGKTLKKAAKDVSFACGLEVLSPFQLDIDSPTLKHQQSADMQRALAEQQTAGRIEHFQRAVELLQKIETQRGQAGPATVTAAMHALGPGDRGAMLRTLLLAGSGKEHSTTLWAVAGSSLLRIDPASDAAPDEIRLNTDLGPFRSVQSAMIDGRAHLLLGARDGVVAIDNPPVAGQSMSYQDGGVETSQGFTSAVVWRDRIVACHGEAGVVMWAIGPGEGLVKDESGRMKDEKENDLRVLSSFILPPSSFAAGPHPNPLPVYRERGPFKLTHYPLLTLRPATLGGSPRNLQPTDDGVLFSVAGRLFILNGDGTTAPIGDPAAANVVAIVPDEQRFIIVYDDGMLRGLDHHTKHWVALEHRRRDVTTAARLPWLGGSRLLLGGDDGPIDCVGTDDDVVTQYQSPHRGVRRLVASMSHVAALSADRGRLIVWNAWEGKSPAREITLVGLTPHRAADVLLT